ncbi:unnamed protein product [Closterium sp. NIES-65]|nr:unnamed protein product [Closterium sp. NIES-65]
MAGYGTELKGEVVSKHLSARVKARKQRTRIAELNVNGTMVCDKQGILDAAADFFNGLFGTDKRTHRTSWLPDRRLSAEEAEGLAQDWSEQEVKNAFKALACGKSPGLDGIPKELFELHWDILGECFMSLARSFEASASLPANTKEAVTILLHKKGDKGQISNYRPITLLNFTYKVLAKVVADRMKKVLHREAAKRQLGIVTDSGRRLPYLGYADDTTLLLQGREQIAEAGKMLDYFERVSGLATNKDKSVVMPLGRNLGGRPWRPDGFKWAGANDAERLLGVWVTASGDCKATWDKTLLRLLGEMGKWELKYLTITARAVVINGYITPIIAFQAQVYPPPQEVWGRISKLIHNFLSGNHASEEGCFILWGRETIFATREEGGVGVKDPGVLVTCLAARRIGILLTEPDDFKRDMMLAAAGLPLGLDTFLSHEKLLKHWVGGSARWKQTCECFMASPFASVSMPLTAAEVAAERLVFNRGILLNGRTPVGGQKAAKALWEIKLGDLVAPMANGGMAVKSEETLALSLGTASARLALKGLAAAPENWRELLLASSEGNQGAGTGGRAAVAPGGKLFRTPIFHLGQVAPIKHLRLAWRRQGHSARRREKWANRWGGEIDWKRRLSLLPTAVASPSHPAMASPSRPVIAAPFLLAVASPSLPVVASGGCTSVSACC